MDLLNKELREQAISLGLCEEWTNLWKDDWSEEKMVEMMYRGLDFCLQHHWPSNDFIVGKFRREFLRNHNIFIDDKYSTINPKEGLVLGKSEVKIRFNSNCYGNIHVRDNSSVKLTAKNRSFVIVHLYENSHIAAEKYDSAELVIVKHSRAVTIDAGNGIVIKEEYDFLNS